MKRIRRIGEQGSGDPLHGVANFFDLGIVFALGFLLSIMSYMGLHELRVKNNITKVKDPDTDHMEIIHKDGIKLDHYKATMKNLGGEGTKLGTAYRLKNGEVVYVPEKQ